MLKFGMRQLGFGVSRRAILAAVSVANQNVAFGASTLASAGGAKAINLLGAEVSFVSVVSQVGATRTWSVSGGRLIANGTPGADNGVVLTCSTASGTANFTIVTTAGTYSVLPDNTEIEAAWTAIGTGGGTIKLRAGSNATNAGPVTLAAKAATVETIITAYDYVAAASNVAGTTVKDARLSTRPATIRGFKASGVINNLTIRGLKLVRDQFGGETSSNGVIDIYQGSAHFELDDCEVAMLTPMTAQNHVVNGLTPLLRGVSMPNGSGVSDDWYIHRCDIHDNARGLVLVGVTNSVVEDTLMRDSYTNFFTVGGATDGLDFINCMMRGVWAATGDSGAPHASIGGSFDPVSGASVGPKNVRLVRCVGMVGDARKAFDGGTSAATGWKANDPTTAGEYATFKVIDCLLVVNGNLGLEFSGCAGIDIVNTTLVSTIDQVGSNNTPQPYFSDAYVSTDIRVWKNVIQAFGEGSAYDPAELSEYDNFRCLSHLGTGSSSHASIFTGDSVKGFTGLTIEEAIAAYKAKPGSYIETAGIGFLAGGAVIGDDAISVPAFSLPAPTGGTPVVYPLTTWDGANDYAQIASGTLGAGTGDVGVFAIELSNVNLTALQTLFCSQFSRISVTVLATSGTLRLSMKNSSGTTILAADVKFIFPSSPTADRVHLAFSYDLSVGRLTVARNGVPITVYGATTMTSDNVSDNANTWRIGANATAIDKLNANFAMAYYDDRFVDLNTVSGLNELFASTGAFRSFSDAGLLWYYGTKAELEADNVNYGSGNDFVLNGSVEDVASPRQFVVANTFIHDQCVGREFMVDETFINEVA